MLSPKQMKFLRGALTGLAGGGAIAGGLRALRNRRLDRQSGPQTFHAQFRLPGGERSDFNTLPYDVNSDMMTPRLQRHIKRNPNKTIKMKFNRQGYQDRAFFNQNAMRQDRRFGIL